MAAAGDSQRSLSLEGPILDAARIGCAIRSAQGFTDGNVGRRGEVKGSRGAVAVLARGSRVGERKRESRKFSTFLNKNQPKTSNVL